MLRKFRRYPKANNFAYSSKTPVRTPQFPPPKRHVNLKDFLRTNDKCHGGLHYHHRAWFENTNYIFRPDFNEDDAWLTFAQSKELYFLQPLGSFERFLDLEEVRFDSRFVFPDLPQGTLYFGNFHDNQLGRIFYLTEPKDAEDVMLSVVEPSGIAEWLKDDPNVKYFRHETRRFHLHVILPVGSRLDLEHELVITHPTSPDDDRELFTQLFEEKLHHALDFQFTETRYERPLSEAEQISRANRVNYLDQLSAFTEKFNQICAIRHLGVINPLDDPVSVRYKGHIYYYNDQDMNHLGFILNSDYEFYQNLKSRIEFVASLIGSALKNTLEEFNVNFMLKLSREHFLAGFDHEVVTLNICQQNTTIHQHSISLDEFNIPSEGSIAEEFAAEVEQFFDRHREKFHAFRKLYETNLSYHRLVDPSSCAPELDYSFIFRTL